MRVHRSTLGNRAEPNRRRGAVLMLSFLVLLVLILIVQQISYSAKTEARVSRNEETLALMDQAIESVLLDVYETLLQDAQAGGAAGGEGLGGLGGGGGGDPFGGDGGEGGEDDGPVDSSQDEWARPIRTEMNELQIRALVQDEDSKLNLLSLLQEDPEDEREALDRLTRVIEYARGDTQHEIDGSDARRMADAMLDFMRRRDDQRLPRPDLLTDTSAFEGAGLPLSLREFVALGPELFPEDLFRDFVDEDGVVVHSLGTFLTVWSALSTQGEGVPQPAGAAPEEEAGDEGEEGEEGEPADETGDESGAGADDPALPPGAAAEPDRPDGRVNLNTAPRAVLEALMERRMLPYGFWEDVLEYRNEPVEDEEEDYERELAALDEYGEEVVDRQHFGSVEDLSEISSWVNIEPEDQDELRSLLKTQSSVFSIYVTARRPTGEERILTGSRRQDIEREEAEPQGLVRTVRSVVWRRVTGEGEAEIIPIVRWEVLDYVPYPVRDFPDDELRR